MTAGVPLSIPRWQWRTFAPDLSWLACRLSTPPGVESQRVVQTHLVCLHSAHHAWLHGDVLELRWRKEVGPEGFELWDTILRAEAPFRAAHLAPLYAAWGVPEPGSRQGDLDVETLLGGPIAETACVRPITVTRDSRAVVVEGIACCLETVRVEPSFHIESFAVEHEDPALMTQLVTHLGLRARTNTSFLQGLKRGLGIPPNEPEGRPWARKSNASTW